MARVIPVILAVIALLYLFGRVTQDQMDTRIINRVEATEKQMKAIVAAAEEHYRLGAETRDGADPWKVEFQFARVNELWPDLFAIVQDSKLQPNDPFDPESKPYLVATQGDNILVVSVGPDRSINVSPQDIQKAFDDGRLKSKATGAWAYDPAKGSKSSGDLIVLGKYRN
jgi:hypothetical protein